LILLGYDAKRLFNNFTGLGNYSRTLLRNLASMYPENGYFLYTPKIRRNDQTAGFLDNPCFSVRTPHNKTVSAFWRTFGMRKDLRRDRIRLFHGLSHEIPPGLKAADIKSVVTIHDLLFRRFPAQYPWIDRQIYDLKFSYACRHADRIVAISESAKRDVMEFYGIDPSKIVVVYQSCHERYQEEKPAKDMETVRERYGLPEDYLLYVGTIIERKNLLGIVQALDRLPPDLRLPLAVVGSGKEYEQKVRAYIRQNGLEKWVHFIAPSQDDMPALYQMAQIFLYPSFGEGFGIPVIEALFSGTPVISSNLSSLPEAAGLGSWLVDPARPEEIAEGIQKILTDPELRTRMVENGLEHARKFRPEKVTREMMGVYWEVLEDVGD
jgi:glycosyltransferase involved in cell wall biosynthesis